MKAMILAAGLGTRLKPWTLENPKALVPVGGVPMLKRVVDKLVSQGFDDIVVNIHHFGEKIVDFLRSNEFDARIRVSDETSLLMDTGGGILHAEKMLFETDGPVLIHNVDILSTADLAKLMDIHNRTGALATLLTSDRDSSRRLVADQEGRLRGWHNVKTGEYRPEGFSPLQFMHEEAFSGIHVISADVPHAMRRYGFTGVFPIMDFYLKAAKDGTILTNRDPDLKLIDIGKPETLRQADSLY